MRRAAVLSTLLVLLPFFASCGESPPPETTTGRGGMHADLYKDDVLQNGVDPRPIARLKTTEGDVVVELDRRAAPKTVAAFLDRVRSGAYDGAIFHRVEARAVVYGGVFDRSGVRLTPEGPAVPFEGENSRSHKRGTIALLRGASPDDGTREFFFNVVDNDGKRPGARNFDFKSRNRGPEAFGYCVFGKAKDDASLAVLDRLAAAEIDVSSGDAAAAARAPRILKATIESE